MCNLPPEWRQTLHRFTIFLIRRSLTQIKWLWRFGEMVTKSPSHVLSDSPKLEQLTVRKSPNSQQKFPRLKHTLQKISKFTTKVFHVLKCTRGRKSPSSRKILIVHVRWFQIIYIHIQCNKPFKKYNITFFILGPWCSGSGYQL